MQVAFIGLGNMGLAMAQNILKSGYDLTVHNRTQSKADGLLAAGAHWAATPGEAAQSADVVITMLFDDNAVEAAVMGKDGILEGLGENAVHISMSTISVELSARLLAAHDKCKHFYLAAPVMGRPDAAQNANLKILLAGDAAAREFVQPLLKVLGSEIIEIGNDAPKANVIKLGLNFMVASMLESMAETLGLIGRYNVDEKLFLDVMNAFFGSPVFKNYGGIMAEQRFEPPGATVTLGLKDVKLVQQAGKSVEMALPLADLVWGSLRESIKQGRGKQDWASLVLNYK